MKVFNSIIKYILVALMALITLFTFYQIVLRYVFNSPSSWSEEVVRYLFIYASFIGAGIGIMERTHIGIDILVNLLPENIRYKIHILIHCAVITFGGLLIYASIPLLEMTKRQTSPALQINMHYIYFSAMLFGGLCIIYAGYEIIRLLKNKKTAHATQTRQEDGAC